MKKEIEFRVVDVYMAEVVYAHPVGRPDVPDEGLARECFDVPGPSATLSSPYNDVVSIIDMKGIIHTLRWSCVVRITFTPIKFHMEKTLIEVEEKP